MLQVKLYSFSGTLIDTISTKALMGNIWWTAQIDGGQWEIRIKLNLKMSSVIDGDIVKVISTDEWNPSWSVVYTGIITKINREIWRDGEYIEIVALWVATALWFVLFTNGARTWSLSSILSDSIDLANTAYPLFTKDISTLSTTGNFDFQNKSILDVVNTIKSADWAWTVDGQWKFIWKDRSSQYIHNLTLGKNIEKISIVDDTERIKNKVNIKWSGGIVTVQDTASISEYWIRELYEEKTDITNSTYATTYGNSLISWFDRNLIVQVYDYDIYSIIPWNLVNVRNTPISISNLQIKKVTYGNNKATLEVEKINSISEALRN